MGFTRHVSNGINLPLALLQKAEIPPFAAFPPSFPPSTLLFMACRMVRSFHPGERAPHLLTLASSPRWAGEAPWSGVRCFIWPYSPEEMGTQAWQFRFLLAWQSQTLAKPAKNLFLCSSFPSWPSGVSAATPWSKRDTPTKFLLSLSCCTHRDWQLHLRWNCVSRAFLHEPQTPS